MVETVTLCKKLYFVYKKFKKKEKEAATKFSLLSQSRNMFRQTMKTYLHRPITILQFLTYGKIQKCFI